MEAGAYCPELSSSRAKIPRNRLCRWCGLLNQVICARSSSGRGWTRRMQQRAERRMTLIPIWRWTPSTTTTTMPTTWRWMRVSCLR
eukprot:3292598-Prymnesium_polylepis.1